MAPEIQVNIWLLHFQVWSLHKWSTESTGCTIFVALNLLGGAAFTWYVNHPEGSIVSWQAIEEEYLW